MRHLTGGGADIAFEVVGLAETSHLAIRLVRPGGAVYVIGVAGPGTPISVDPLTDLLMQQNRIQGVSTGSTNIRHGIPMFARLYLDGRFDVDDLISREIPLAAIDDAYTELEKGEIARSVITSFRGRTTAVVRSARRR